jgi:hypothetical protein
MNYQYSGIIDKIERYTAETTRHVMTSHITLSVLLVFAAVALLRAFQLQTKLLLRGVILLFIINYVAIRTSQDYISSGQGYRDSLFKQPVPPPPTRFVMPEPSQDSASASVSGSGSVSRPASRPIKPFQEDKTFEF